MKPSRAIEILTRQQQAASPLRQLQSGSPDFSKWRRDTEVAIERIFGPGSRHVDDFKNVRYSLSFATSSTTDNEWEQAYREGLARANAILESLIDEIRDYELQDDQEEAAPDQLNLLEGLRLRFHTVARQLQHRHENRETIKIDDEYDVQDLLHALLKLHFDDVRPEEWSPSYAGRGSRLDFLLKHEKIVVEVKKTRPSLKAGELGEQLIVDRARYERHPDCETLVCFVYDPEGRIGNPVGLERDLETHGGQMKVRVIVAPKG